MARRMVRQRPGHSTGDALTWFFDHGCRRFGFDALPIVRAAGWAVFNRRHVTKAATGTPAELARQGLVNAAGQPVRCVRLERAPRGARSRARAHDPPAAGNPDRSPRGPPPPPRPAAAPAAARDPRAPAAPPR